MILKADQPVQKLSKTRVVLALAPKTDEEVNDILKSKSVTQSDYPANEKINIADLFHVDQDKNYEDADEGAQSDYNKA